MGRLQAELLRAVRLVVDTGIHHKRWTREQAIDYMASTTGMAMSDVESEIERYIVWPGQALAYKVGMMKILELREKAKTTLGDRYDIREFHDVVLKNGAVPMTLLERLVDEYIVEKKGWLINWKLSHKPRTGLCDALLMGKIMLAKMWSEAKPNQRNFVHY